MLKLKVQEDCLPGNHYSCHQIKRPGEPQDKVWEFHGIQVLEEHLYAFLVDQDRKQPVFNPKVFLHLASDRN